MEEMIKRMNLMNNSDYRKDMDKLAIEVTKFLARYELKGVMGFYKGEQFKISILFDDDAVNTNIVNP